MAEYACKNVTVYCSSSDLVNSHYVEAARDLGRLLAENRLTLVFGGGRVGLMGVLSESTRAHGGAVKGVILQRFLDIGVADAAVDDMQIVPDMRSRKAGLEQAGDAHVALPGGFGTFEEITEIISFKQLGYHNKPIVFLNTNGYFVPMLKQFELSFSEQFVETRFQKLYNVVETPEQVIELVKNYKPPVWALKYSWSL